MRVSPIAFTQINPALERHDLYEVDSDIGAIWKGAGTMQENLIEYAGRVCYRSTARAGHAENFVVDRVREGHVDIIEHIVVTMWARDHFGQVVQLRDINRHCEVTKRPDGISVVTANLRVWLDLLRDGYMPDALSFLMRVAPKVFGEFGHFKDNKPPAVWGSCVNREQHVKLMPRTIGQQRITLLAFNQPVSENAIYAASYRTLQHGHATFMFEGISRACTHQLVRHRLASFSQESQRYTSYDEFESDLEQKPPPMPKAKAEKRDPRCKFSTDQEQFIADVYAQGFSGEKLADRYGVDPVTIRNIVLRCGVPYRDRRESRSIHIQTDFFSEIDTPVKAQVLGLIYADGNVATRDDGKVSFASIAQHSDYKAWLGRLGRLWGGTVISGGRPTSSKLTIPGIALAESLVRHGVIPAKSKILEPPNLKDDLVRHFIRGYIEGDGHISKDGERVSIAGTKSVLEWMQTEIGIGIDRSMKQEITKNSGVHRLDLNGKHQAKAVIEWLYDGFDVKYAHPAKLAEAVNVSANVAHRFDEQVGAWAKQVGVIVPPKLKPKSLSVFMETMEISGQQYANLRALGIRKEDARFLLPNAAETRIITSMSFAAWSHFFWLRAVDRAAQWEIRQMAQEALELLNVVAPEVFVDHMDALEQLREAG